jgi:hypothetical protein
MRPSGSAQSFVIVACVALAAVLGFAWMLIDNGELGLPLRRVLDSWPSRDKASGAALVADDCRRAAAPAAQERLIQPSLLAAVPGGLCLLI